MKTISILDTTLRDGAQSTYISYSLEDKLSIIGVLDGLSIPFIEVGNPAASHLDRALFQRLRQGGYHSNMVAFGATAHKGVRPEDDAGLNALLEAGTQYISLFGKASLMHVKEILGVTPEENLRMIEDSIRFLVKAGRRVFFDAEHYFDGYKLDRNYALLCLQTAQRAGADTAVLCDTCGGTLPHEIAAVTRDTAEQLSIPVGIHTHDDTGCAVASAISAVDAGAVQVQGTFLGYGERCGNCNLSTLIPDLQLKLGYFCVPEKALARFTTSAAFIAEVSNIPLRNQLPYVGASAFAHKAGMHVDAVSKLPCSFEHIEPERVGNTRQLVLSEMSGRAAILRHMESIDATLNKQSPEVIAIADKVKEMTERGFKYEAAGASFEMLVVDMLGRMPDFFRLEEYRIIGEQTDESLQKPTTAMVKISVGGRTELTAAEGNGPINALDSGLRKALEVFYPVLKSVRLTDFKVRVITPKRASAAVVRVLISSTDGKNIWSTVGASDDVIGAGWLALADSMRYKLYLEYKNRYGKDEKTWQ